MIGDENILHTAQRQAQEDLNNLFTSLTEQVSGAVVSAAGPDGMIALEKAEELRERVRQIVQQQFVVQRRLGAYEQSVEEQRLQNLITRAREEARRGSEAHRQRVLGRLRMLSERYALLKQGITLDAFDNYGQPASPYARLIVRQFEAVTRAQVAAQARQMEKTLRSSPEVIEWLRRGGQSG